MDSSATLRAMLRCHMICTVMFEVYSVRAADESALRGTFYSYSVAIVRPDAAKLWP